MTSVTGLQGERERERETESKYVHVITAEASDTFQCIIKLKP